MNRRKFLTRTSLGMAGGAALAAVRQARADWVREGGEGPLVVSTWPFGKPANDAALGVLLGGGGILDAVEHGGRVPEADRDNKSVGLSGIPNAAGVVQLDACIMSGPGHRGGSVAALEGIRHPISVARRVMEKTKHVMLAGEGARMFAIEEGFEAVADDREALYEAWRKQRGARGERAKGAGGGNHDTIALLVLGANGDIAGGCSTSGWGGKLPGRVGDSPILGSGLYVDNDVGAAGATGLGENVMRYCGSFLVVELMRQGLHPREACLEALRRIARQDPLGSGISVSFVALDKQGRYGAAGSAKGFEFAVATRAGSRILTAPALGRLRVGPEGGNRR